MRQRDNATEGVPTFLLLEETPSAPARPSAEGEGLAGLAGAMLGRLAAAPEGSSAADAIDGEGASGEHARDQHPSLRQKVPLTLEALGALRFAPRPDGGAASAPPQEEVAPERGDRWSAAGVVAAFKGGRYVRAVNFHATPPRFAGRLETQLSWLAERFTPVGHGGLRGLVDGEGWPRARPPLILNFFDGRRDNFEVAAPMLERLGLVGWFFVVSGWVAAPPEEQRAFALRNHVSLAGQPREKDGRLAMAPEEVNALAERGHVVASHTRTHAVLSPSMTNEEVRAETAGSKQSLEGALGGGQVRALAWRGGSALGADVRADRAMREAGYELLLANHIVQKVR